MAQTERNRDRQTASDDEEQPDARDTEPMHSLVASDFARVQARWRMNLKRVSSNSTTLPQRDILPAAKDVGGFGRLIEREVRRRLCSQASGALRAKADQ